MAVENFSTPGSHNWVCPAGVTSVLVECWGGGGAGGGFDGDMESGTLNNGFPGGAGGQYARKNVTVNSGNTYVIVVAAARQGVQGQASNGNDSTFNTNSVVAKGGQSGDINNGVGGQGSTSGGIGDIVRAGGSGAVTPYDPEVGYPSGGGGGAAGPNGPGNDAYLDIFAEPVVCTGGQPYEQGGISGKGADGLPWNSQADGLDGSDYGGGGASGMTVDGSESAFYGGDGAQGYVKLTYTVESSGQKHHFILASL